MKAPRILFVSSGLIPVNDLAGNGFLVFGGALEQKPIAIGIEDAIIA
jgi:hypothetical protein